MSVERNSKALLIEAHLHPHFRVAVTFRSEKGCFKKKIKHVYENIKNERLQ